MRRPTKFLTIALLIEVIVLGWLYYSKVAQSAAPMPRLETVDTLTAADLAEKSKACTTGEEFHELGDLLLAYDFYPEANAAYKRAAELLPESAELAYDYGYSLLQTDQVESSIEQFSKAIELKSERASEAMYFVGRNHLRAGDSEKAEVAFRKAALIPRAKFEAAKILVRKGEIDQAKEYLVDIGKLQPNRVQTSGLLTRIAEKKGDERKWTSYSGDTMNKWKAIDDPIEDEDSRLNSIYRRIGFVAKRIELVQIAKEKLVVGTIDKLKAMQEVDFDSVLQQFLIDRAYRTSRYSEAIELIEERNDRLGVSSVQLSRKAECYMKSGEYDLAVENWVRGAKLNTDAGGRVCNENISRFYLSVQIEEQKSIPFQIEGLGATVFEAVQHREFASGLGFAKKLVELGPENAECYYLQGLTQLGVGQLDNAIESFKKCTQLDPTHGRGLLQLKSLGIED